MFFRSQIFYFIFLLYFCWIVNMKVMWLHSFTSLFSILCTRPSVFFYIRFSFFYAVSHHWDNFLMMSEILRLRLLTKETETVARMKRKRNQAVGQLALCNFLVCCRFKIASLYAVSITICCYQRMLMLTAYADDAILYFSLRFRRSHHCIVQFFQPFWVVVHFLE